ncbi:amidase family protein, partial [Acinetobacter baumannii]
AGLTALELGSDIASSIRNPAHFCGVFGHKPTFGICPTAGHSLTDLNPFTDIAVAGPMARSAADLELALAVLAGPDGTAARAASL